MKTRSEAVAEDSEKLREKLLGAGLKSMRKSYYPQLQAQLRQLQQEIAARKLAEEEVLKLNQELEQRVLLRTRELESANAELEAFTSMVSHDLRGPLRRIRTFMELLQQSTSGKLNEENQTYIDRALDGSARMDSLISDLLVFSRAARVKINQVPIDLKSLFSRSCNGNVNIVTLSGTLKSFRWCKGIAFFCTKSLLIYWPTR